jgi:hypothetical protein
MSPKPSETAALQPIVDDSTIAKTDYARQTSSKRRNSDNDEQVCKVLFMTQIRIHIAT